MLDEFAFLQDNSNSKEVNDALEFNPSHQNNDEGGDEFSF